MHNSLYGIDFDFMDKNNGVLKCNVNVKLPTFIYLYIIIGSMLKGESCVERVENNLDDLDVNRTLGCPSMSSGPLGKLQLKEKIR